MFPKHQSNYTFYQNSGALLIAIFGALSVADYNVLKTFPVAGTHSKQITIN